MRVVSCLGCLVLLVHTCAAARSVQPDGYAEDGLLGGSRQEGTTLDEVEWTPRTIIAIIITFTVSGLANAGGIGGGGFLVPLFNLVLGVSLKEAMGLSQAGITGGAIAAGALALFSSHPNDSSKPLLDMNAALLFLPCLLLGVTVGVTLNQIFPDWVLLIVISILLAFLCVKTFRTATKLHRAEVAARELKDSQAASADAQQEQQPETPSPVIPSPHQLLTRNAISLDLDAHSESQYLLPIPPANSLPASGRISLTGEQEAHGSRVAGQAWPNERNEKVWKSIRDQADQRQQSSEKQSDSNIRKSRPILSHEETGRKGQSPTEIWAQIGKLLVGIIFWAVFLGLQVIKSHYMKCTATYLYLYGAQIAFAALCTCIALFFWWRSTRKSPASDIEQNLLARAPEATSLEQSSLKRVSASALIISIGTGLSALCGLGGGSVLGPVLLDLGIHPLAASATGLLLVGASSSAATAQFALGNRLLYGYGSIIFVTCFFASLIGVAGLGRIVRKSGRGSLIVFLLFGLTAAGGLLTVAFGAVNSFQSVKHGEHTSFLNLCEL